MSYENNGAPLGSFIDLTHSQSLFVAPVVKWKPDDATWVKLEAEYNQLAPEHLPSSSTLSSTESS